MALLHGLLDREVLFFGGKGGVGKTTCAAAMALAASRLGRRVLLVSTDPAHSTSDIFERPIGADPVELQTNLWGLEIDAAAESARYVREVKDRVGVLFGPSILKEAFRQIDLAASMPGAEEVALFDRMGGLIRGEDARFDLVIFDTAPTGHTLRLVKMPELMDAWIRALTRSRRAMLGVEGDDNDDPILVSLRDRYERLRAMRARLLSGRTTAFVLVLIPERLPIEETSRALAQLDEMGVKIGGLVVNRVLPGESGDTFLRARRSQERVYLDEIDARFADRARISLPQYARDVYGLARLGPIANVLAAAVAPPG
jgi:arsenite-transporting ATPase